MQYKNQSLNKACERSIVKITVFDRYIANALSDNKSISGNKIEFDFTTNMIQRLQFIQL